LPAPEKIAVVKKIKERLENGKAMVIAEYRGINVKNITELRRLSCEANVEFKVLKNRLTARAAQELGITGLESYLEGPNSFAFSYEDPVAPAKVLSDFAKKNNKLVIKGGLLSGKVIDADGVRYLAELPARPVLIANVLRGMQAPIAGLANVLSGNIRNLVYALEAIRQQKESGVASEA